MTLFDAYARLAARNVIFPVFIRLHQVALRIGRPFLSVGSRPEPWQPGGQILIIAPHPDDETLGAGGTAALHARHGDRVTVVVVTDGRGARGAGLGPETLAKRRSREVEAAVAALGVRELVQLGMAEDEWEEDALQEALAPFVAGVDILYAPSCVDFHPDHLHVAEIVAKVIEPSQTVRVYELGVPLTPILANCVADIGSVRGRKERALAAFATQREALRPAWRAARYRAALYGGKDVELFWEMSGRAYQAVIARGDWDWQTTPFRAFRPRPVTDLLPFVCGRRMRLELRRVALRAVHSVPAGR